VKRILVGVDGSEGSRQALAWAIDHAAALDAVVQPAIVWQRTFDYGSDQYWPVDEAIAQDARKRLTAVVAEVAGPDPAATIDPLVFEGDPGKTLCAESAAADLLVVGSRGLGGFAGLVLGSVSTKCAHHSRCPLVIVPHRGPPGGGQA
jgi:nucleotide-binding universal stress UspA family protein